MNSFRIKLFEPFKNKFNVSSFGIKCFNSCNNKLIQILYLIGNWFRWELNPVENDSGGNWSGGNWSGWKLSGWYFIRWIWCRWEMIRVGIDRVGIVRVGNISVPKIRYRNLKKYGSLPVLTATEYSYIEWILNYNTTRI